MLEVIVLLKHKKQVLETIKKELPYIFAVIGLLSVIFEVLYYKEPILHNLILALSIVWLFILPGYFILLHWSQDLELLERIVIGTLLGLAFFGIISYFIGFIPIHIRYHSYILPPITIILGFIFACSRENTK